ncbi:DUF4229 domain-containing protein [Streptomyces sp. 4N509B]|uniref:DUF4229 domain-containing protein n=1 Tax=Streptomyces sp. 4N509B TaxID=3457413 RepID=UPI003FD03365
MSQTSPTSQTSETPPTRHATLRYTAMRLGIFAGCFVVIAILAYVGVLPESVGTANPLWIALLSIVVSAPISFVVLRRQRDAMATQITTSVGRARERLTANQSMEDDADDAARA